MLFLSSFDHYSREPKEAPKDPEQESDIRIGCRSSMSSTGFHVVSAKTCRFVSCSTVL